MGSKEGKRERLHYYLNSRVDAANAAAAPIPPSVRYARRMHKGVIVGWLVFVGLGASCGDDPEEEAPAKVLPAGCEAWCAKASTCAGVTREDCERQCAEQFSDEGPCGAEATRVVTCFEEEWDATCEPPPECLEQVKALASCTGLGCEPGNGICGEDAANDLDCRCGGGCGAPWQFQANCQLQGNQVFCDCFLSGPLAPVGPVGTIPTTCSGPAPDDTYCQQSWGCCRAKLLP